MYKIFVTKKAEKELDKLSSSDIKQVVKKIPQLSSPFKTGNMDIKKLSGIRGFYRLRIGKIRIIFEIDEDKREIWIRKIGYRSRVYRSY